MGFRGSDAYQEWKKLLHHFYDPFPTVDTMSKSIYRPRMECRNKANYIALHESRLINVACTVIVVK